MPEHIVNYEIFQMIADFSDKGKPLQIQTMDNAWHKVIEIELFRKPYYFVVEGITKPTIVNIRDIKGARIIE